MKNQVGPRKDNERGIVFVHDYYTNELLKAKIVKGDKNAGTATIVEWPKNRNLKVGSMITYSMGGEQKYPEISRRVGVNIGAINDFAAGLQSAIMGNSLAIERTAQKVQQYARLEKKHRAPVYHYSDNKLVSVTI